MDWFNQDQVEGQASTILGARFTIHNYLKILSEWEIDRAMIKGDHGLIITSNDH